MPRRVSVSLADPLIKSLRLYTALNRRFARPPSSLFELSR